MLLVAILHFILDEDDPVGIVGQFREVMAPGSHLVISHAQHQGDDAAVREVISIYQNANVPLAIRSSQYIADFFHGFELLEPGLVPVHQWRPANQPHTGHQVWGIGGVARVKPRAATTTSP